MARAASRLLRDVKVQARFRSASLRLTEALTSRPPPASAAGASGGNVSPSCWPMPARLSDSQSTSTATGIGSSPMPASSGSREAEGLGLSVEPLRFMGQN
jgi:hypothetical protein